MALALNKIIVSNVSANTASAYLQPTVVSNVGSGNLTAMLTAQYIPAGIYQVLPTANVTIELNAYTGTANAWSTYIAANTAGVVISDGYNLRANATTGTQTITLWTVNGGQTAPGTYTY